MAYGVASVQFIFRSFVHNKTNTAFISLFRSMCAPTPLFGYREERGVYEVRPTSGMSKTQVLAVIEELEAAAPAINAKIGGGIGGDKFKLADIV